MNIFSFFRKSKLPDFQQIENELQKRLAYPYKWGMKQNDQYDRATNFIYKIPKFDDLLSEVEFTFRKNNNKDLLFNYAINRWYNFWSANTVENIFCSYKGVKPHKDKKDRLVDFSINKINFDHKTTVYPKAYKIRIAEAMDNPRELIKWLYKNQSEQQRLHLKNRLFIVIYDKDGEHWKLKADITLLSKCIKSYIEGFDEMKLHQFNFEKDSTTLSDIIWCIK